MRGPATRPHLPHRGRCRQAAGDVADGERHGAVGAVDEVVPVAADVDAARCREIAAHHLDPGFGCEMLRHEVPLEVTAASCSTS